MKIALRFFHWSRFQKLRYPRKPIKVCSNDLINSYFEEIAGIIFITGITPPGSTYSNWSEGVKCSVLWDNVTDFLVFNSLDEYCKAVAISNEDHEDEERK